MDFAAWFEARCRGPFPIAGLALVPFGETIWVSEGLQDKLQAAPVTPTFLDEPNYVITGHWGYGINSYAFYFIEVRGRHRRFFRLFLGGVYGDAERDARFVRDYLAAYEGWRRRREAELEASTLIHNMGVSTADLIEGGIARRVEECGLAWFDRL